MTRKDTILIAVVINAGLLAILFTTAVIYDTDKSLEQTEFVTPLSDNKSIQLEPSPHLIANAGSTKDEVDRVLKYYSEPITQRVVENSDSENLPEPIAVQLTDEEEEEDQNSYIPLSGQERFVEVKVKKGDVLEKIAKANKTTVSAIKKFNHLQNERLSIGQTLKIPVGQERADYVAQSNVNNRIENRKVSIKEEDRVEPKRESYSNEPVYYVVKSGDNPWKIAKQFGVRYDDILRLNHMDEDKARNLKIGDRIRVK